MTDQQPDPKERITLSLTIDFDVDMKYKDMIIPIMEEIVGNLAFSGSGNGIIKPGSTYQYKLTTNQPSQPITLERIMELIDQHNQEG